MIFSPIDNFDYQEGNLEQEFLFAYRALAKEYHAKASVVSFAEEVLAKREKPSFNYEIFSYFVLGSIRAYNQMGRMRAAFNVNLKKRRYSKVFTKTIKLEKFYPMAVSSMISLDDDFEGNQINDLVDLSHDWSPLFITIFPQGSDIYILVQCLKNDKAKFDCFFKQIITPSEHIGIKISAILITHCENMVISPDYWDSFLAEQKESIMNAFIEKISNSASISDYLNYRDSNLFQI